MPSLFTELRQDLLKNKSLFLRELVIPSSEGLSFNSDKPRIRIHETRHPAAKNQFAILANEGLVEVVRAGNYPIYRLTESFVDSLEAHQ